MNSDADIQFNGPSWGHHGPYTFFRSFSYRRSIEREMRSIDRDTRSIDRDMRSIDRDTRSIDRDTKSIDRDTRSIDRDMRSIDRDMRSIDRDMRSIDRDMRSVAVGQFFFVRILAQLPICIAELQLLWESRRSVGTKLASVKLYFTPEDTPSGRRSHHGQDELLVADEKVVLEVSDLVKWIVDSPVTWPYGFRMFHGLQLLQQEQEEVSLATEKATDIHASGHLTINGYKQHGADGQLDPTVVIVTYAQYCRYRALAKRLRGATGAWMQEVVVMAMSGIPVVKGDARLMFCRDAFAHPELMFHDFRRDRLAPKLKGRKRRKKLSRLDSVDSVDSDAGQEKSVAITTDDVATQRMKATMKRFKGLTMPSSGMDLISSGKEAFEQHLFKFMRDRKTPIKRIPSLGFKEVDLFQFFIYSQKFGGYDKVTEGRHWKQIYDQMGGHPGNTSAATCTRRIYEKLLLTFERHVRGEEDKPLPVTYMRPARKKLRELATMHDEHVTLVVTHDQPSTTEMAPAPLDDLSMATGDKTVVMETEATGDVTRSSSSEPIAPVSAKVDISGEQSVSSDDQLKVPLAVTPPPPLQPKFKLKHHGSSRVTDFKNPSSKDPTVAENNETFLAPPGVADQVTGQKVNPPLVSINNGGANSGAFRTPTSSRLLSLDQSPTIKGDSLPKTLPLIGYPLPFVAGTPFVSPRLSPAIAGGLESVQNKDGAASVVVATATAPSNVANNPSMVVNPTTLASFGFLPPKIIFNPPNPGSARSSVVRPTYGPPNLLSPLTSTSNGLLVPLLDTKSPVLCRPISIEPQKPSTLSRRETSEHKASPGKPDPGSARSGTSSAAWFNSPIKQFLDRTRAMTPDVRSNEADDQPIDLSVRSLQKTQEGARDSELSSGGRRVRMEQEEPLNLSRKHETPPEPGRGLTAANLVLPATKKVGSLRSEVGRVVLPKSDLLMPLILSVPSPMNILAQSNPAAVSCFQSLTVTPSGVTNSFPTGNNIPASNGLLPTPTILSPASFPTSLVGTALRPVYQFFPSHPLASNIAYASEAGRPLLLRFPMPQPPPPTTTTTQAPSLVAASKGNRS